MVRNNIIFILLFCFGCSYSVIPQNNDIKIQENTIKKSNVNIEDRKLIPLDLGNDIVNVKSNNLGKTILLTNNSNVFLFDDDKLNPIGSINKSTNLESSISLDNSGYGSILYTKINTINDTGSIGEAHLRQIQDYKLLNNDLIIENDLRTVKPVKSFINKDGNGLLIYRKFPQFNFLRKINNYILDKSDNIIQKNNNDIDCLNSTNFFEFNLDSKNNLSLEITNILTDKNIYINIDSNVKKYKYIVNNNSIIILLMKYDNTFELNYISESGQVKKYKLSYNKQDFIEETFNMDSFYISELGNGFIISQTDKISIYKVNNFITDFKNNLSYTKSKFITDNLNTHNQNFVSILNNKAYVFWNDVEMNKDLSINKTLSYFVKITF